jgi:hypothetical protein
MVVESVTFDCAAAKPDRMASTERTEVSLMMRSGAEEWA